MQVVPRWWVEESTRLHSRTGEPGTKSGYGWMWWVTAEYADRLIEARLTAEAR